jgi:peptidyl-prolyl cis-trans isomerase D
MKLAFFRRHVGILKVFLVVIIAAFIYFYVPAFRSGVGAEGTPSETLAKVGGETITVGEFQRAYLDQRRRLEQIYQGKLDPALVRQMRLEERTVDALVEQKLMALEAKRVGIVIDDEAVADKISNMAGLRENGHFVGAAEYRRRLESQGRSVEEFEGQVRDAMVQERLEGLVTDGVDVSAAEAEREYRKRTEQIKTEYVLIDSARYKADAKVSDEAVKARFDAKKDLYRVPEKRSFSYVLVDASALRPRVTVTDADLEAFYQEHKDELRQEEQVCASHVLVKVKSGDNVEGHSDAEAKTLAQNLLEKIRSGADLAAVATQSSEDKGSASKGGDLGCFARNQMVPEFDDAAFSLEPGAVSGLVKSPFGYHIIKVASHRPESVPALTQVKDQIRMRVEAQRTESLADQLTGAIDAALRSGKTLEQAAQEQGLKVDKSPAVAKDAAADPKTRMLAPVLSSPALLARVFELEPGKTEPTAFAVARGRAFVGGVDIQPAHVPELKEVQDKVKTDLVAEESLGKAKAVCEEIAKSAAKTTLDKAATGAGLVRKETQGLVSRGQPIGDLGTGIALEEVAYSLPEKTLSDPIRVGAGYALLRVLEKKAFDPVAFEKERASIVSSLREEKRNRLFQAFMAQARQRYSVERNPDAYKRIAARS